MLHRLWIKPARGVGLRPKLPSENHRDPCSLTPVITSLRDAFRQGADRGASKKALGIKYMDKTASIEWLGNPPQSTAGISQNQVGTIIDKKVFALLPMKFRGEQKETQFSRRYVKAVEITNNVEK